MCRIEKGNADAETLSSRRQQVRLPLEHFDLVHSQIMSGGIHADRWDSYVRDIFRVLRPGGWVQIVEIYFNAQSDNGMLTDGELTRCRNRNLAACSGTRLTPGYCVDPRADSPLRMWSQNYLQSLTPYKDPRAALRMEDLLREAGFHEIDSTLISFPTCGWSPSWCPAPASLALTASPMV